MKHLVVFALAALLGGCAGAPPRPEPASPPRALTAALPPDRVVEGPQSLRVAGEPMAYEVLLAHLPERLALAAAADALVDLPADRVADEPETLRAAVEATRGVSRGYPPGFRARAARFRYYPYRDYYFPYFQAGEAYYPLTARYRTLFEASGARGLFAGATPFLYRYGGYYYPLFAVERRP